MPPSPEPAAEIALDVQDIHHGFGAVDVLQGVSLQVRQGEIVGVIGPGGAGKSVLIKVCCGLLVPDEGDVVLLGQRLREADDRTLQTLRNRLGLAFQNYALFDFMTVARNVAFPMVQRGEASAAAIDEKVQRRLAEVDLPHAGPLFPNELSGGMKKRVGLARASINDPEFVFFDDPTAGLDPVTSSKIFRLVRRARDEQGASCLVVSHDIDRMQACVDRFVLLYRGQIRWRGTSEEGYEAEDAVVRSFFRGGVEGLTR